MIRYHKRVEAAFAGLRNLVVASNGLSLTLVGQPRKMVGYAAENWFLYRTYTGRRGVPQRSVFEICGNGQAGSVTADIRVAWVAPDAGQWLQPLASYTVDLIALCSICALVKPKVIFEIGTLTGYAALHFALNTSEETEVYTLDLPLSTGEAPALETTLMDDAHIRAHDDVRHYAFDGYPEARKIHTLFGDSACFDYAPFENRVDLFFIDGAHSYDYVRQDTLNAFSCGHSGSVLAWHDYGRSGVNGVSKWIDHLSRQLEIYAVPGGSLAFTILR